MATGASMTRPTGSRAVVRGAGLVVCVLLAVAACSSESPSTPNVSGASSTTTAPKAGGKKAGVEFAAAPKGPVGPDSTQANKCYALRAYRYLLAMPESGRFFKDKLAETPKVADEKLQTLRKQLELAIPPVAGDIASLADDAHTRLLTENPSSGLAMLGTPPDKALLAYLSTSCTTETVAS